MPWAGVSEVVSCMEYLVSGLSPHLYLNHRPSQKVLGVMYACDRLAGVTILL